MDKINMHVIICLLGILSVFGADDILYGQTNATHGAAQYGSADEKTGIKCVLGLINHEQYKGQRLPAFQISVVATKTNQLARVWTSCNTNYLVIALLKPDGTSAGRTSLGSNYVAFPALRQVSSVFDAVQRQSRRNTMRGFRNIQSMSSSDEIALIHITTFSLPELFDLEGGEYLLKVRMRLLEQQVNKAGSDMQFDAVVLPEVSARIKISSKITPFQQWQK
jgi:hypothetical protein